MLVKLYRHFRNRHIYLVIHDNVLHTETKERLVLYKDLGSGEMYVRPYDSFFGPAPNDSKIKRFELVKEFEIEHNYNCNCELCYNTKVKNGEEG
jgi:hypothetical protein